MCKTTHSSFFPTIKRVKSFAVANSRKRVVIKLIIKIMWIGLRWRPMLLVLIVRVTAFRTTNENRKHPSINEVIIVYELYNCLIYSAGAIIQNLSN